MTTTARTGYGVTNCQYCGASLSHWHACPRQPAIGDVSDLGAPTSPPFTWGDLDEFETWAAGCLGRRPRPGDIAVIGCDDDGNELISFGVDATDVSAPMATQIRASLEAHGATTGYFHTWSADGASFDAAQYLRAEGIRGNTGMDYVIACPLDLDSPTNPDIALLGATRRDDVSAAKRMIVEHENQAREDGRDPTQDALRCLRALTCAVDTRSRRNSAAELAVCLTDADARDAVSASIRDCDILNRFDYARAFNSAAEVLPAADHRVGALLAVAAQCNAMVVRTRAAATLARRARSILRSLPPFDQEPEWARLLDDIDDRSTTPM